MSKSLTPSSSGTAYFVPHPSHHPIAAAFGLLGIMLSLTLWINGQAWAAMTFGAALAWLFFVLWGWFGDAIGESEAKQYGKNVDKAYRWSMSWFIFSEVMFFAAFFGALFYARTISNPSFGDIDHQLLWPHFEAIWPNAGPAQAFLTFKAMTPWPIPTINTALLLASGATLTLSHHALRADHRRSATIWLGVTIALGLIFLFMQGFEYFHAYHALNLTLTSGVYGSLFFLLTGFHGFHVTLGTLMLSVVFLRMLRGHFSADHHFAFEGAAWYWHFVDVVWLGLYVVVYWL